MNLIWLTLSLTHTYTVLTLNTVPTGSTLSQTLGKIRRLHKVTSQCLVKPTELTAQSHNVAAGMLIRPWVNALHSNSLPHAEHIKSGLTNVSVAENTLPRAKKGSSWLRQGNICTPTQENIQGTAHAVHFRKFNRRTKMCFIRQEIRWISVFRWGWWTS